MLMLKAKAEQDVLDKTRIFYELVFQQELMYVMRRLIEMKGSANKFNCEINCEHSFNITKRPNYERVPEYTKEIFQDFVNYCRDRMETIFPDYDVKTELYIGRSIMGRKYHSLWVHMERKVPSLEKDINPYAERINV